MCAVGTYAAYVAVDSSEKHGFRFHITGNGIDPSKVRHPCSVSRSAFPCDGGHTFAAYIDDRVSRHTHIVGKSAVGYDGPVWPHANHIKLAIPKWRLLRCEVLESLFAPN